MYVLTNIVTLKFQLFVYIYVCGQKSVLDTFDSMLQSYFFQIETISIRPSQKV